ncbi:hypothetical protein HanHA300_Chr14g0517941 [Helianthus annuus]|nr:hypothetical protein HanIR_Chr16g0803481 [Helianthus annuus]KAJ0463637.1 hypothetical protein HanHA300_Chr14g0517941 [Helianthus annuus]
MLFCLPTVASSTWNWKLLCYHLGSPSDFQLLSRKVSLVQRLCHIMILLLMVHCQLQGRKDFNVLMKF